MSADFGPYVRELRKARGIPLRRFADAIGMDPSNYSRVERGEAPPPQEPALSAIAEQLGMQVGRDAAWYELISRAALARGRVPDPVLQEEEVARLLPAFFARVHQLRGTQPVTLDEIYTAFHEAIAATQARGGGAAATHEQHAPTAERPAKLRATP